MMRSTLAAAAFGILAAMPAIYLLSASPRQETAAARAGAGGAAIEAAAEAWPICSSMASLTESADWAALDPDFAAGKRALVAGDWTGAIKALRSAGLRDRPQCGHSKLPRLCVSTIAPARCGDATLSTGAVAQSSAPRRA
jgi:hypothetical protein